MADKRQSNTAACGCPRAMVTRADNALRANGLSLEDAIGMTDEQLLWLRNIGKGVVRHVRHARPAPRYGYLTHPDAEGADGPFDSEAEAFAEALEYVDDPEDIRICDCRFYRLSECVDVDEMLERAEEYVEVDHDWHVNLTDEGRAALLAAIDRCADEYDAHPDFWTAENIRRPQSSPPSDAVEECSHCGVADTDSVCDACDDVLADEQTRHQEWF